VAAVAPQVETVDYRLGRWARSPHRDGAHDHVGDPAVLGQTLAARDQGDHVSLGAQDAAQVVADQAAVSTEALAWPQRRVGILANPTQPHPAIEAFRPARRDSKGARGRAHGHQVAAAIDQHVRRRRHGHPDEASGDTGQAPGPPRTPP